MLKYSREIRSPLSNIYMLGIVLPTLGIALMPLASTLLGESLQWFHLFILFNVLIPFIVFFMTSEVLLKRPGGYGDTSILTRNPNYHLFISKKPWIKAGMYVMPLILLGLLPFIFQISSITNLLGLQSDYSLADFGLSEQNSKLFDFKVHNVTINGIETEEKTGPFGPFAIILSLCIPLAIGLFFAIAYRLKTEELMKARQATAKLEEEFTNSLFQLGNRLGDGIPAEIAFSKVAESTQGQTTHDFFTTINQNIQNRGMSVEQSIFDKRNGALIYFPSALIATSMRILVESVKKGLQVAASSLMSISDYVKNINKINQRLRDLMAEVVSDMKSNMTFLAPMLSGIVVGLSSMIIVVLNKLETIQLTQGSESLGAIQTIMRLFDTSSMIPSYFLQISVGLYIVEMVFILSSALVVIDAGKDSLREKSEISKNLKRTLLLYFTVAFLAILFLSALASLVTQF